MDGRAGGAPARRLTPTSPETSPAGGSLWGAIVWVFGEAFGGILAPGASVLTGAPGSVLMYAAATLLLLRFDAWLERRGAQAMAWVLAAYWFLGAVLMVVSGGFVPAALAAAVANAAATPQPAMPSGPMARVGGCCLWCFWRWGRWG